jgi:serine-type D-Ala-D-Ala carboxypeptidase/endopeptidase
VTRSCQGIQDLVEPLLSAVPDAPGTAVAARRGADELVLVRGTTARGGPHPIRPDTRFEIGSLTKTFTALLLAEMVARGDVRYDDPVDRYLPVPGQGITLQHLATHTSGLPRLPPGLLRAALRSWYTNPYRAYGPDRVLAAMNRARRRPPGERVHYSNFAVGVLGHALAAATDRPYEDLLTERVLRPLELHDTDCRTAPQATGHWRTKPRPPWQIPGLPAAGALRSTALDLLRLLTAYLTPHAMPLATALAETIRPRELASGVTHVALVWNLRHRPDHDLIFHSGGTRGFTAFTGFSPQTRTALVALTNTSPTLRDKLIQPAYEALSTLAATTPPAGREQRD